MADGSERRTAASGFDARGILYPARLPTFVRLPAPESLTGLVCWFWIPEWDLAPGRVSRQSVLPFPASNLVVECVREHRASVSLSVALNGPATRVSHRDLRSSGWAVGALLRPAAVAALGIDPTAIRDAEVRLWGSGRGTASASAASECAQAAEVEVVPAARLRAETLGRTVAEAMAAGEDAHDTAAASAHRAAAEAFASWFAAHIPAPDEGGRLANEMEDLIAGDRSIVHIEQAAERLGISVRGVQRLARRYVGVPPLAIIRRYRLQEAAQRLREDPDVTIAQVAADLGYADHAHLTRDFRAVLDLTPAGYRRGRV
ncbi:helix-turn-helix domain-containing protein [Brevibacterium album]|uniref:helix-turn-helix domain-containing protein n=1 Tax=Brevibacterium album TaxID=417948 RepID=UPI0004096177|nr:helix-turn-helix domain-containing protein [Brevibacterium album]